jgi:alpha-beta hydrolase superfamily lysophospholipase
MSCPRLLYWGGDDRQMAKALRRARTELLLQDVDFVELAGLDHAACNTREALGQHVVPMVDEWLSRRVGRDW